MRRLMTKFWKEIAYLVGFAVLVVLQFETIGMIYLSAGAVWFVICLPRNSRSDYANRDATGAEDYCVRQRQERYLNDHWTRSYHG